MEIIGLRQSGNPGEPSYVRSVSPSDMPDGTERVSLDELMNSDVRGSLTRSIRRGRHRRDTHAAWTVVADRVLHATSWKPALRAAMLLMMITITCTGLTLIMGTGVAYTACATGVAALAGLFGRHRRAQSSLS